MSEKTTLQKDFYRESGKWLSKFEIFKKCFNPNLHFIYLFRTTQKHPKNTVLGKFWGLLAINPKVIIGKNCNIAQGVSIAQANRGKFIGTPIIGDEVWIGPNAVIVGGITIGNNVLIAPNVYLAEDVPDNSLVIGNPCRIFNIHNATEGYINNKV